MDSSTIFSVLQNAFKCFLSYVFLIIIPVMAFFRFDLIWFDRFDFFCLSTNLTMMSKSTISSLNSKIWNIWRDIIDNLTFKNIKLQNLHQNFRVHFVNSFFSVIFMIVEQEQSWNTKPLLMVILQQRPT